MKKSYRRVARRRHVSLRVSWETYVLLLMLEAYEQSQDYGTPAHPSRRRRIADRSILRLVASQTRYVFVQCLLDDAYKNPEWSGEELAQYYSGFPSLTYEDIFRFVSKNDPCERDDFENQDLADN